MTFSDLLSMLRNAAFSDLLSMLRNAAAEFGAETPIQRIPLDRDTAAPDSDPSSYTAATLNPVRGRDGCALLIRLGPNGTMKLEAVEKGETDVHRESLKRLYGKRNRIIRETGTFPATATTELQQNPNEALDTDHD